MYILRALRFSRERINPVNEYVQITNSITSDEPQLYPFAELKIVHLAYTTTCATINNPALDLFPINPEQLAARQQGGE